jgi:hypothetical protein
MILPSFRHFSNADEYMRYWLAWEQKNPCHFRSEANCLGTALELSALLKPWRPDVKMKIFQFPFYDPFVGYGDPLHWNQLVEQAGLSEIRPPSLPGDIGARFSGNDLDHVAMATHQEQLCFDKEGIYGHYQLRPCSEIGLTRWYRRFP